MIPLIGVGFMYPQGYFHQTVSPEGWQQEVYERLNWTDAPIEPAIGTDGRPCVIAVPLGNRTVLVSVWQVLLGRVKLFLLDTDLEENAPWDRELSARLYGGDRETRIQQEIILGIGGVRALKAMGIQPAAWHLNEGHAAFVVLQRIRDLHRERRVVRVCARGGPEHDDLHDAHAGPGRPRRVSVQPRRDTPRRRLGHARRLSRSVPGARPLRQRQRPALQHDGARSPDRRTSSTASASSTARSRATCGRPSGRASTTSTGRCAAITNGIHVPTWLSLEMAALLDEFLPGDWRDRVDDPALWDAVIRIPDERLWETRQALRTYLFAFIRERARQRWKEEHVSAARVVAAGTLLDPSALTIGFARRFTGYKRSELIFHNPERLVSILTAARRPVQIVFAGKAHPADETGKHNIQKVYRRAIDPMFAGRIAFVDDYDLHVAHFLVQGCDVWLNNPRKPLEASGTSGMKASINGVPHLSIGDGWWAEGYSGAERLAHRRTLRRAAIPTPSMRPTPRRSISCSSARSCRRSTTATPQGIPRRWCAIVRQAILSVTPRFSARRMVKEYAERDVRASHHAPAPRRVSHSQR